MRSYAATEENSSVKLVRKSVFFSTSRRSSTPQRRTTSSLSVCRLVGSASGSSFGTVIHGSPLRVVTFTPPAEPSTSAADSRSRPAFMRFFRSAMNALGFSGWRIAA